MEVGRLLPEHAECIAPLLDEGHAAFTVSCMLPLGVGVGMMERLPIRLTARVHRSAFVGEQRASLPPSADGAVATSQLSPRRLALARLLALLGIQPSKPAAQHTSFDLAANADGSTSTTGGAGGEVTVEEDGTPAVSDAQLQLVYSRLGCDAAELSRHDDGGQPRALVSTLHAYQRQGVGWMRWREMERSDRARRLASVAGTVGRGEGASGSGEAAGATPTGSSAGMGARDASPGQSCADACADDELHPAWARYAFPAEPSASFYLNPTSGAASLELPGSEGSLRGGVLADEMGLGKTVMMIALVLDDLSSADLEASPADLEASPADLGASLHAPAPPAATPVGATQDSPIVLSSDDDAASSDGEISAAAMQTADEEVVAVSAGRVLRSSSRLRTSQAASQMGSQTASQRASRDSLRGEIPRRRAKRSRRAVDEVEKLEPPEVKAAEAARSSLAPRPVRSTRAAVDYRGADESDGVGDENEEGEDDPEAIDGQLRASASEILEARRSRKCEIDEDYVEEAEDGGSDGEGRPADSDDSDDFVAQKRQHRGGCASSAAARHPPGQLSARARLPGRPAQKLVARGGILVRSRSAGDGGGGGGQVGATLVVCPTSLLSQWHEQISLHAAAGSLSVYVYYGCKRSHDSSLLSAHDIVLTTWRRSLAPAPSPAPTVLSPA